MVTVDVTLAIPGIVMVTLMGVANVSVTARTNRATAERDYRDKRLSAPYWWSLLGARPHNTTALVRQ